MHVLYLTDRLSVAGGADQHLLQVAGDAVAAGLEVTLAHGRVDGHHPHPTLPTAARAERVKGLATAIASSSGLRRLPALLHQADVIHVQNVMNPVALHMAVQTGRAVVTVQDHRFFCPGQGKTLPTGAPCRQPMSDEACASCLPDPAYRSRTLQLTHRRCAALRGAHLLVLSSYMARELTAAGLPEPQVLPPWVATSPRPATAGQGFLLGGRLVPHKGVLDAWQAWQLASTGQPLVVAGAGPLAAQLQGADQRGWLPVDQLRTLLAASRALLFPSFWQEPFGMLGVMALAEGTPVIVAESGGTAAWSGVGCLPVPPGDKRSMMAAMRRLASDPAEAGRLGEQGRAAVMHRFARAPIKTRLLQLYRTVARTRRSAVALL